MIFFFFFLKEKSICFLDFVFFFRTGPRGRYFSLIFLPSFLGRAQVSPESLWLRLFLLYPRLLNPHLSTLLPSPPKGHRLSQWSSLSSGFQVRVFWWNPYKFCQRASGLSSFIPGVRDCTNLSKSSFLALPKNAPSEDSERCHLLFPPKPPSTL